MKLSSLMSTLATSSTTEIRFAFDSGDELDRHFHVSEVGKVSKDFLDCGGIRRITQTCVLQTWVANDTDHRIEPAKLLGILEKASVLEIDAETEVQVEIQGRTIEIYSLKEVAEREDTLVFCLASRSTACLAGDRCGVPTLNIVADSCCGGEGGC